LNLANAKQAYEQARRGGKTLPRESIAEDAKVGRLRRQEVQIHRRVIETLRESNLLKSARETECVRGRSRLAFRVGRKVVEGALHAEGAATRTEGSDGRGRVASETGKDYAYGKRDERPHCLLTVTRPSKIAHLEMLICCWRLTCSRQPSRRPTGRRKRPCPQRGKGSPGSSSWRPRSRQRKSGSHPWCCQRHRTGPGGSPQRAWTSRRRAPAKPRIQSCPESERASVQLHVHHSIRILSRGIGGAAECPRRGRTCRRGRGTRSSAPT
jgi:hypothetical protein